MECPNCRGQSPDQATIIRQVAESGDVSGACGLCDNTHEVEVLHLKTQRGQPYGSERRCCEECGIMIGGLESNVKWTADPENYAKPPAGFIRCADS